VLAAPAAADWLSDCEVESDCEPDTDCEPDCEASAEDESDALVAPLPGASTALPCVANVFRFAALTSYEIGVASDMYL
jgi:hypothetical protein